MLKKFLVSRSEPRKLEDIDTRDLDNFLLQVPKKDGAPRIFCHYINVDEVSRITLKKLLQSAMELLQIATDFLLQSATRSITSCDRCYKAR